MRGCGSGRSGAGGLVNFVEFDFADETLVVGADVGEDEFLVIEGVEGVRVEVALGQGLEVRLDVALAFDGGLVGVEGAEGSG